MAATLRDGHLPRYRGADASILPLGQTDGNDRPSVREAWPLQAVNVTAEVSASMARARVKTRASRDRPAPDGLGPDYSR
jgi:hypothetical protein